MPHGATFTLFSAQATFSHSDGARCMVTSSSHRKRRRSRQRRRKRSDERSECFPFCLFVFPSSGVLISFTDYFIYRTTEEENLNKIITLEYTYMRSICNVCYTIRIPIVFPKISGSGGVTGRCNSARAIELWNHWKCVSISNRKYSEGYYRIYYISELTQHLGFLGKRRC